MVRYGPVTSAMVRYGWSADEIKDPEKSCSLFGPALSFHSPSLSNLPQTSRNWSKTSAAQIFQAGEKGSGKQKDKASKEGKKFFSIAGSVHYWPSSGAPISKVKFLVSISMVNSIYVRSLNVKCCSVFSSLISLSAFIRDANTNTNFLLLNTQMLSSTNVRYLNVKYCSVYMLPP